MFDVDRPIRVHEQHVMKFSIMTDFTVTKDLVNFRAFVLQKCSLKSFTYIVFFIFRLVPKYLSEST
jgi:hypothetical protein